MMSSYPMEKQHLDAPVPRITIPMLRKCPEPTLPLSTEGCRRMAEIPFLVNFMDGTHSPDRARFWLAYDCQGIEVAGRVYAPDHGRDDVGENQELRRYIKTQESNAIHLYFPIIFSMFTLPKRSHSE